MLENKKHENDEILEDENTEIFSEMYRTEEEAAIAAAKADAEAELEDEYDDLDFILDGLFIIINSDVVSFA